MKPHILPAEHKHDAIIFDIDGTLWNACAASAKGWNAGLQSLGIQRRVTPEQIEGVAGNPYEECVDMLLPGLRQQYPDVIAVLDACETEAVASEGGRFYDGVISGLQALAESHRIFLVSNCQDWYLQLFLEKSGVQPWLDGVDCHGMSGLPKAEMLRRMQRDYSLHNPVYVGDTQGDESAAFLAGMGFIHVTYGFGSPAREVISCDSFAALLDYFNLNSPSADEGIELTGGNMNTPRKKGNLVYKDATAASPTIHRLLCHVRAKGIDWVPESYGIRNEKHVLQFIEGEVPDDTPDWLWDAALLPDIGEKLRLWHDATLDFDLDGCTWVLENDEPNEVICHSDFAPYNCVFEDHRFKGLIDFDVCSPGSRLWDMAYTAYRFIPLVPGEPFPVEKIRDRLQMFLASYSQGDTRFLYTIPQIVRMARRRLLALAEWTRDYAASSAQQELIQHAELYERHANRVMGLLGAQQQEERNG